MEGRVGGCGVAKACYIAKVLHTDRSSDEPGCRGAFAPNNFFYSSTFQFNTVITYVTLVF